MAGDGSNPFQFSLPVTAGDLVDRQTERQTMLDLAWSGNNSRVAAPRRYGKTSLLKTVLDEAEKRHGFKTVYVDLHGVVSLDDIAVRIDMAYAEGLTGPLVKWWGGVQRTLKPILRVGGGPVPAQIEVSPNGEHPLIQRLHLPERVFDKTTKRVLIVFDEFQDVLTTGDSSDKIIRSVIQHHAGVASYIFGGSHIGMMHALFASRDRAFFAQAERIPLPPLRPDDLADWISDRFEHMKKDPGEALGPLLDMADGHPQKSMFLAHHLWRHTPPGHTATLETWVTALDSAMTAAHDEIIAMWDHLTQYERRVITVIAENQYRLKSQKTGLSAGAATNRAVEALLGDGEIIESSSSVSGYKVTDPLFAYWLRTGRH
jgi:uncharacterized protein